MLTLVEDLQLQTLCIASTLQVDVPAFWAVVKSLLNEAMPHPRNPTIREKALLRALHPHVEATARK